MNGDWSAMEKLVIAKMTEHSQHLGALRDDIAGIKTHIAIVSTFIGALFAWFRPA